MIEEKMKRRMKFPFAVIGMEGSTLEGEGFVQRLWVEANARFGEVEALAKRDSDGVPVGVWGLMSDLSHSFRPWEENFSVGCYLAGVECEPDAEPPEGWTKWVVPGYEYVVVENSDGVAFSRGLEYLRGQGLSLVGAAHDFHLPRTGQDFIYFPVLRLED